MIWPYISTYKCTSCDEVHHLSFKLWFKTMKEVWDYIWLHLDYADKEEVLKRVKERFNIE